MTRDPANFLAEVLGDLSYREEPIQKWEFWSNGRSRSRTVCIRLFADSAQITIAHRGVGTDGCMSELNTFSCNLEHLPQLVRCLHRALAVANEHGLIKQPQRKK
jgi:hypothetical protein